ncbi:hypothetical protein ACVWYF_001035 [Hymenobacter sp. UYAg731]
MWLIFKQVLKVWPKLTFKFGALYLLLKKVTRYLKKIVKNL